MGFFIFIFYLNKNFLSIDGQLLSCKLIFSRFHGKLQIVFELSLFFFFLTLLNVVNDDVIYKDKLELIIMQETIVMWILNCVLFCLVVFQERIDYIGIGSWGMYYTSIHSSYFLQMDGYKSIYVTIIGLYKGFYCPKSWCWARKCFY